MPINKGKLRIETSINCSGKFSDEQSIAVLKKKHYMVEANTTTKKSLKNWQVLTMRKKFMGC